MKLLIKSGDNDISVWCISKISGMAEIVRQAKLEIWTCMHDTSQTCIWDSQSDLTKSQRQYQTYSCYLVIIVPERHLLVGWEYIFIKMLYLKVRKKNSNFTNIMVSLHYSMGRIGGSFLVALMYILLPGWNLSLAQGHSVLPVDWIGEPWRRMFSSRTLHITQFKDWNYSLTIMWSML